MSTSTPADDVSVAFRQVYQALVDQTRLPSDRLPTVGLTPRPRRPRYRWVLATAAVAVVVGAVGVALLLDDVPPAQLDAVEGFRAHQTRAEGGMSAIVTGIVEVDLGSGCIWLSDHDGARYPAVWPLGTTVQVDPFGIVLADGQLVQPGDRVEGGGGSVDADNALTGMGLEPFPAVCVQVGEAAVFNADSPITVTPGEGLELAETLVGRFSPPQPIGLELIAINPNTRSVAVVDFVTGTVHQFEPGQYEAPTEAIDGASGGGGFIHLWSGGTIHTYWPLDEEPLVFQPEPLREMPGFGSTLEVLPGPDGDHTWLVQPSTDGEPTLVELVNVVGFELSRLMSTEVEGPWRPMGATIEGLILSDGRVPSTRLIGVDGTVEAEVPGTALSVGWNGAAILQPDGSLVVTDPRLDDPIQVEKPGQGEWLSVGGPVVPAASPPVRTATDRYLVMLATDPDAGSLSPGLLIVVDSAGAARTIYELSPGSPVASWSRGGDWVVVVEGSAVTLISVDDGSIEPLGNLIPDQHWVLTAG